MTAPGPAVLDRHVFVLGGAKLTALTETGDEEWVATLTSPGKRVEAAAGVVLVSLGGAPTPYVAFDSHGRRLLEGASTCPPLLLTNGLVLGCQRDDRLELRAGNQPTRVLELGEAVGGLLGAVQVEGGLWISATSVGGPALPQNVGDRLFFVGPSGTAQVHQKLWHTRIVDLGGQVVATVKVVAKDPGAEASLLAIGADGATRWETPLAAIPALPQRVPTPLAFGEVVMAGVANTVVGVTRDGKEFWRKDAGHQVLRLALQGNMAMEAGEALLIVRDFAGSPIWKYTSQRGVVRDLTQFGPFQLLLMADDGVDSLEAVRTGTLGWTYRPPPDTPRTQCDWRDWTAVGVLPTHGVVVGTRAGRVFMVGPEGTVSWSFTPH